MPFLEGFEDLTGTFTVVDVVLAMTLSFILCAIVGLVYKHTHRGISYTQKDGPSLCELTALVRV